MKKFLKLITNLIFYLICFFLILIIGVKIIAPEKTIAILRFDLYRVQTSSMEPVLPVQSLVVVKQADEKTLKAGDIITFYTYVLSDGKPQRIIVTHYIGEVFEKEGTTYYKTQGYQDKEAGKFDQDWVDGSGKSKDIEASDVIGVVAFSIPLIGYVVYFLQTLIAYPLLLLLIILNIIVLYVLFKIIFKSKKEV